MLVRHVIYAVALTTGVVACNKAGDSVSSPSKAATKSPTTTTKSSTVSSLSFTYLTPTTIYTSDGGTNNCSTFKVTGTDSAGTAVSAATVDMTISGVTDISTVGQLSTPLVTDSDGIVTGTFCAGSTETKVVLIATSGTVKANSGTILVTKKPTYALAYRNSDFDANSIKPKELLNLNLLDSGPNDCGNIYFQLKKVDTPIGGVSIKFQSDFGYPAGAKLRVKSSTDTPYEADPATQKNFLSYTATSDADGIFKVPVCAGQVPGSFIVFANYTDPDSRSLYVKSPTISVSSGVANLIDIGITYNTTNAKVLKAFFNNEAPTPLEFVARLSSVFGGALSVLNPLYVHSESGTLVVDNAGVPDNTGAVKFSMLASYNGSYRPTPVRWLQSSPSQATCDPESLAYDTRADGSPYTYVELSKNWRSTLVYMVRGQEPFHDANRNGKYDVGGDGFWDINQDGVYTQGTDYITCVAGVAQAPVKEAATGASNFHSNGEWFIDLPTPFIDANENGTYEATDGSGSPMDRLIGDVYQPPNGKRDVDTLVWKSMFLPVYTGPSQYSMLRSAIKQGDAVRTNSQITPYYSPNTVETSAAKNYFISDLFNRNLYFDELINIAHAGVNLEAATNMTGSATAGYEAARYVHAQGMCGTPVPGGTKIEVTYQTINELFGNRAVTFKIYQQPGDEILDPSRRMLVSGGTGNSAIINFNISDHPSRVVSYPVLYNVDVAACTHVPDNGTGLWCADALHRVATTVDGSFVTTSLHVPAYDTHVCKALFHGNASTGNCDAD